MQLIAWVANNLHIATCKKFTKLENFSVTQFGIKILKLWTFSALNITDISKVLTITNAIIIYIQLTTVYEQLYVANRFTSCLHLSTPGSLETGLAGIPDLSGLLISSKDIINHKQ